MKLGLKNIEKIYLGVKEIANIYLDSIEIYANGLNGNPSGLNIVSDSDTQQTLTWVNGATNQDGTKIYRSTDGITYELAYTLVGSGNSHVLSDLTAATLYYWKVVHYKGSNISDYSNIASDYTYPPTYVADNDMFCLTGEIIEISGSKYFKDKSPNGRNFLITGYDFKTDWTLGFPYKSAAYISAPAGDAGLIAWDTDKYLYDETNTPRLIPVTSIFQDIHYAHKLFSLHTAQIVDENGVEIFEPRVAYMVGYANAKSSSDLTTCQTWFNVPTEITSTVKWVDPINGDNTSVTGSKLLPWKTMAYAEASASSGDTIYVKTGITTEGAYLNLVNNRNWKSVGFTEVRSTGTSYVMRIQLTTANTIEGFIVNAESRAQYGVNYSSVALFKRNYLKNATTYSISSATRTLTIRSCVSYGKGFYYNYSVTLDGCYNYSTGTSQFAASCTSASVTNCRFNHNASASFIKHAGDATASYVGSSFTMTNALKGIYSAITTPLTKTFTFKYNHSECHSNNSSYTGIIDTSLEGFANTIVENNYIYSEFKYGIRIINSPSTFIQNNIFDTYLDNVVIANSRNVGSNVTTYRNIFIQRGDTSHAVMYGTEATTAGNNSFTAITHTHNTMYGSRYFNPSATPSSHGLFFGFINGIVTVEYDRIIGSGMGIVIKGSDTNAQNFNITHTIIANSYLYGVVLEGCTGAKIYNNTLSWNNYEFYILKNPSGGGVSYNHSIKNNILNNNAGIAYKFDADSYAASNDIDHNVVFGTDNIAFDGTSYYNQAQWLAKGYDANSEFSDPLLTDYIPAISSPAISNGETLDAAYDDGLDASTDWGGIAEFATVVTKQQGASWDIGAYVH